MLILSRHLVIAGTPGHILESTRFLDLCKGEEGGNIIPLGQFQTEDLRHLLAAADIFALPSWADSFGMVYLEAWCAGLPVIGASTAAICEVIRDGVDGLLVPPRDVASLARVLEQLLLDPALRHRLGQAGKEKVLSGLTWPHALHRWETLLSRLNNSEPLSLAPRIQ